MTLRRFRVEYVYLGKWYVAVNLERADDLYHEGAARRLAQQFQRGRVVDAATGEIVAEWDNRRTA